MADTGATAVDVIDEPDAQEGPVRQPAWRRWLARFDKSGAIVAGVLLLVAAFLWLIRAIQLWKPNADFLEPIVSTLGFLGAGEENKPLSSGWVEWLQFTLALAGVAAALVLAGLTASQAVTGEPNRRIKPLAFMLVGLLAAWWVTYRVGR